MTVEEITRLLYHHIEKRDLPAFAALFSEDGYFWSVSMGRRYRGCELTEGLKIYVDAFPNIHREIYDLYISEGPGNRVVVELSLNGTHKGPMKTLFGIIPPGGKNIHVPCCDVLSFEDGKVISFHSYVADAILLTQLGLPATNPPAINPATNPSQTNPPE